MAVFNANEAVPRSAIPSTGGDACRVDRTQRPKPLLELIPSDLLHGARAGDAQPVQTSASTQKTQAPCSCASATDSTEGPSEFSKPNP